MTWMHLIRPIFFIHFRKFLKIDKNLPTHLYVTEPPTGQHGNISDKLMFLK